MSDQTSNTDTSLNTTAPDPGSFDLDSWITGGWAHRPTRTVTIYRDLHLAGELSATQERLDALDAAAAEAGEDTLGGDPERDKLESRLKDLAAQMRATSATVSVAGLTAPEETSIQVERRDPQWFPHVLAIGGRLEGRELTAQQWQGLYDTIGHPQWARIIEAYQAAQQVAPDVTAPFSRKSSRRVTGD